MKAVDIRKMSDAEIAEQLTESRHELMNLRFQTITGQITDTTRFKVIRKDVARLETILRERQLVKAAEESKE